MRHWLADRHFRSLLKNSGYLTVAKVIAAIASLATLALAGRGLGLEGFGLLILVISYAQAASGISRFQSWQLIIRYGGGPYDKGDADPLKRATGFSLGLDIVSGLLGMVGAMLLLPLVGGWFGLPDPLIGEAMLYCLIIPFLAAATPVGILRVLDRFDLLSLQSSLYPIVRAILIGIAYWQGWPFAAYLLIWFLTEMFGQLLAWWWSWRELRRKDLTQGIAPTLRPDGLERAWPFAINVNLTITLKAAWGPVARLIVGGLLGPAGAALYRVAASIADSAQKPADLFAKAFYPEIVKMDVRSSRPWQFLLRGAALAAAIGLAAFLLLVIGGRPLIALTFGEEFLGAFAPLLVMAGVPLLVLISFPLQPTLYALDKPQSPLIARAVGVLAFLIAIFPLSEHFGLIGAAGAYLFGNVVMTAMLVGQTLREYRRIAPRGVKAPKRS
ncbi:lipopolysaccharide biosynthesis protein [Sphingomicrobium lutaoense]|uniref:O-antigen/teichoic acid export membrane protein n=1 Tax=Sphingomicrobium lutaoense TaxID=515949 RepID=A0A839YWS3_9SPHN|nr:lipopolysaccharide biosynthesis protein [Sphingomicrobium lutaoense]MBB3763639.1 O-antigen/teichoic acid export membrane protein [Sphingomicrobium lutaoense]